MFPCEHVIRPQQTSPGIGHLLLRGQFWKERKMCMGQHQGSIRKHMGNHSSILTECLKEVCPAQWNVEPTRHDWANLAMALLLIVARF